MKRVLVVATSQNTRGGITAVIKAHKNGAQWKEFQCKWIPTHIDKNTIAKVAILVWGFIKYLFLLPGADLVHIHFSEPTSAKRKVLFLRLAKKMGKKVIVHFHSFSPDTTINSQYSSRYKELFCKADVVVVLSNYWKKVVNEKFHLGNKIRVIYNPCPFLMYSKKYEKTNSILYAGTLNRRKGYEDLIKAFAMIAPMHTDWKVIFAGNGEIDNASQIANKLGVSSQVSFIGWVNGADKDKAYKEAKVFCLPSYAEGFPMAVLDAWAYGLPVVTTPVGGIPDIANDRENLLLFSPGNIEQLSNCLDDIISNEELRNKLAAESYNFAMTTFNINTINMQIGELYKEVLNN